MILSCKRNVSVAHEFISNFFVFVVFHIKAKVVKLIFLVKKAILLSDDALRVIFTTPNIRSATQSATRSRPPSELSNIVNSHVFSLD